MAIYWCAPKGTVGIIDNVNTGGRTENTPWSLDFCLDKNNMGNLFQDGDRIYLIGNKGEYLKTVADDINYFATVRAPGGGVDFETEYNAGNYIGIRNGSLNFMTAPGHPEAVLRRTGVGLGGTASYLLRLGETTFRGLDGNGVVFWNVRITTDGWVRDRPTAGNGPISSCIACYTANTGLVNSTIDNGGINCGPMKTGDGAFLYAVLSSQSGWSETDRKHGHCYYIQNRTDLNFRRQSYINCIGQFACGLNYQVYAQSPDTVNGTFTYLSGNLNMVGNHAIDAGAITGQTSNPFTIHALGDWNYLMGGYQEKINNTFTHNTAYSSTNNGSINSQGQTTGAGVKFGYIEQYNDIWLKQCFINDNYLHLRGSIAITHLWKENEFERNTVITSSNTMMYITERDDANWHLNNSFNNNIYYGPSVLSANNAFRHDEFESVANPPINLSDYSIASWRSTFGQELDSVFNNGIPSGTVIFYRKNDFIGVDNPTAKGQLMGHIIIYNWDGFSTVDVDLDELSFVNGDQYVMYDTQNFAGQSIQSGTYTGADVATIMEHTAVTPTKGNLTNPSHTDLRHIVVKVYKTSNIGGTNSPPSINTILNQTPISKDSGQQTINLTGINDPDGDTITIQVESNNPSLFNNLQVNYTSPNSTGTITYTPSGIVGTATITVTVSDPVISIIRQFTVSFQDTSIPNGVPSNVVASLIGTSSFNISWNDNSTNETGFEVEVSTTTAGGSPIANSPFGVNANQNNIQITGLESNTLYFIRVRAINNIGTTAYSSEIEVTTSPAGQFEVLSLSLIDITGLSEYIDVIPLVNGATYNLNENIPYQFTVEANTDPTIIEGGSVVITHVERAVTFIENGYPYNMGFYDAVNPGNFPGFIAGTNTIRVIIYDGPNGTGNASPTFEVVFTVNNNPAFLESLSSITMNKNTELNRSFIVTKAPLDEGLTITIESSNPTLLPVNASNLVISGSGRYRSLFIKPIFGNIGKSTVTLTLSDGVTQVQNIFDVTVVDDSPVPGITYTNDIKGKALLL